MFLVTLSSTQFTARESCQLCDASASKKLDALFQQQSQYLSSMAYEPAVCAVYMKIQKLTAPPSISFSVLPIHEYKIHALCLCFRVTSKMSTKTHSQLCLRTSKFLLLMLSVLFVNWWKWRLNYTN